MIDSIRLWRYRVPFHAAILTSQRAYAVREGFIISAPFNDRFIGWGEIAPLPGFSSETSESVLGLLPATLLKLGELQLDLNASPAEIMEQIEGAIVGLPPTVRFGIETLIADLYSQAAGKPLREVWFDAEKTSSEIEVNYLLTNNVTSQQRQIERLMSDRVTTFKLKVGRNPTSELQLIDKIRGLIGEECKLRLDANRAFDYDDAARFLDQIAPYNIEYIEEPLKKPAIEPLRRLVNSSTTPLALDETIAEWRAAHNGALLRFAESELVNSDCFSVAILKPALLGGLREQYLLVNELESKGIRCVVTSALDCAIGVTAAAQVAGALSGKLLACGLATSGRLESSLGNEELQLSGGKLMLPQQPGLGMAVDLEAAASWLEEITL